MEYVLKTYPAGMSREPRRMLQSSSPKVKLNSILAGTKKMNGSSNRQQLSAES